jgi:lipopolysaccharide transport system ATP-binding protein
MQPIIQIESLGKRYRIGQAERRPESLRETAAAVVRSPFRYLRQVTRPPTEAETLWALRNISLDIQPGEAVGIVGRNGSGKSTLLKILSRITEPTEGRAVLRGRVGSLLEVGTGFHPELTGRENVFLNGAILGMSRREIERKFDEIIAFSEIERFIDTPVKRYSSGMYVRLAFSVAAHLEPEVLIVDEVLSVGDVAFRKKCQDKMTQASQSGRTVLFVSHSLTSVRRLCPRAVWLHDSHIKSDGSVESVLAAYLEYMNRVHSPERVVETGTSTAALEDEAPTIATTAGSGLTIKQVVLKNQGGAVAREFQPGESMTVEVHFHSELRLEQPYIWLTVDSFQGSCFSANMLMDGRRPEALEGNGVLACTFEALPLLPQQGYALRMAIRANDGRTGLLEPQEVAFFRTQGNPADFGLAGPLAGELTSRSVPLVIPYVWTFPDGSRQKVQLVPANIPEIAVMERASG